MAFDPLSSISKIQRLTGNENIVLTQGDTPTGNGRYPLEQLKKELGNKSLLGSVTPLTQNIEQGVYIASEAGVYTNFGNIEVTPEDFDNGLILLTKNNDGTFSKDLVPMPGVLTDNDINVEGGVTGFNPIGEVKEGDKRAVSGNEVFVNLPEFNYTDNVQILTPSFQDCYIPRRSTSLEGELSFNPNGYTSVVNLDIRGLSDLFIKNLPTDRRDVFFHNEILNEQNRKSENFTYGVFSTTDSSTLKLPIISGYKYCSFTALFADNDVSKLKDMLLSNSENISDYGVWGINGIPIKINNNVENKRSKLVFTKDTNECYILSNGFRQLLQVNRELNKPFDISNTYISDNLIGSRNDESAPYRIDNNTLGGNHLVDGVTRNKNHSIRYFADNKEVVFDKDLDFDFNEFKIIESYLIMRALSDEVIAETNLCYTFKNNIQCIIDSNIVGLVDGIDLKDIMFLMNNRVNNAEYVIPNTENFQIKKTISENTLATKTNSINKDNSQNRVLNISDVVVMKIGFLPLGSNLKREENTSRKRLEIRGSSGKIYISTIDSATINKLNKGDIYSAVGYKDYSLNNGKDYSITCVTYNGITYIVIDIYSTDKKQIKYNLPSDLQFKELQNDYDNLYNLTNNVFEIYTDKASIILSSY